MKDQDKFDFNIQGDKITFNDVFLKIKEKSNISSRKNINLSVSCRHLKLNLPILGANMSTIIDGNFAKYLALMGGIGVLHQNCTIEQQLEEVYKVKKYATPIIKNPKKISPKDTVYTVKEIFEKYSIGALIVIQGEKVIGIVTKRDIDSAASNNEKVESIMSEYKNLKFIESEDTKINLKEAERKLKKSKCEQIPIINSKKELVGLLTSKGINFYEEFPNAARDENEKLVVAAAIGINKEPIQRAKKLVEAGVDMLVLDTANGWNERFIKLLQQIRNKFPNIIIAAGNIDNPHAGLEFAKNGADIIKVGIGPGGACKTRIQTGFGKPQISSIWEVKKFLVNNGYKNTKIIADGGIKAPGDLAKSLAVGADFGMMGSLFAGTDKAVGQLRYIGDKLYKDFRGMASLKEANNTKKLKGEQDGSYEPIFEEGSDDIVPYKGDGSFFEIVRKFHGGLASSFSYANANNIQEFFKKTVLGKQSLNGEIEGKPQNQLN